MKKQSPENDPALLAETSLGEGTSAADTNALTSTFHPSGENADAADPDMPAMLGRYEVRRPLGRGAFGVVYLGWDPQLKRQVAIKVPRLKLNQGEEQLDALLAEARRAVQLERHQGIVPVYDVGRQDDLCYIVSQYVDGGTLSDYVAANELDLSEKLNLFSTIADTIEFAHQQGWVHRDIKPSNILVDASGRPYLTDFGLTTRMEELQSDSSPQGTPYYMAPEQIRGAQARVRGDESAAVQSDHRADVYSLGVVLYELLTGQLPFPTTNLTELFEKVLEEPPEPLRNVEPALSPQLERVCLKALAKNPDDRFQTAAELGRQLRAISEVAVATQSAARGTSAPSGLARSRVTKVAAAIVLLLAIGLVVFFALKSGDDDGKRVAPGKSKPPKQLAQLKDETDRDKSNDVETKTRGATDVSNTHEPPAFHLEPFGGKRTQDPVLARRLRKMPEPLAKQLHDIEAARNANEQQRELALVEKAADEFRDLADNSDSVGQSVVAAGEKISDRKAAYTRLGLQQLRSGFAPEAAKTLKFALRDGAQPSSPKSELAILTALAAAQSQAGNRAAALDTYQSAEPWLKQDGLYEQKKELLIHWTSLLIEMNRQSDAKGKLGQLRAHVLADDIAGKKSLDGLAARLKRAGALASPKK